MEETMACVCQRADWYKFWSECYYLPDHELMGKIADAVRTDWVLPNWLCLFLLPSSLSP
jgi:hypothetical protein